MAQVAEAATCATRDRRKIEEKLNYMHHNPVRRGLVAHTVDWKWSSARWYERRQTVGVPISWVE